MRDVAVVSGYLVRCPLGGYAWQALHYVLGLEQLGYEAYFDESTEYHGDCFDPGRGEMSDDPAAGLELAAGFFAAHGLQRRWAFDDRWRGRTFGLAAAERAEVVKKARLWLTLGAVNRPPSARRGRDGTLFVDLDPGYTQARAAAGDAALTDLLGDHTRHFTFGENIGTPACALPTGGFEWRPTRQPVLLSLWSPAALPADAAYTTVGRWDERRREIEIRGERYSWRKRSEWLELLDLPARTGERFRLAMDVEKSSGDAELLREHGWEVVDPIGVSADADAYRDFIRASRGEFTVAKDLNVRLRTGWFSDRAACYLAAGRPVVNQQTGFDAVLPVGRGLFDFVGIDGAVEAFARLRDDYAGECAAARRLAEEYFDARRVLAALLAQL